MDLDNYNEMRANLPINLFNEFSDISSNDRINYQLKITEDERFSLTTTITDYKNYLYIIHDLSKLDTLIFDDDKVGNYSKILLIEDSFQYRLTIKDAFNDIDPNNFAPN